jgi:hypothetical protein
MRAKEIINEGPIWQGVKSKLGGGTYTSGYNVAKGQQQIAKMAKDSEPYWFKQQASYQQRNIDPKQLGDYLTQWARKWFNSPTLPGYEDAVRLPQVTDQGVRQYLKLAASHYLAPQLDATNGGAAGGAAGGAPAADIPAPSTNAAGVNAMSAMASQLGSWAAPTSATSSTGGVTTPTAKGVMHQAKTSALFQDPVKFKSEFDKYLKGIGNAEINDELKNALKTMWMQAGGTRLESKKYKGKRV